MELKMKPRTLAWIEGSLDQAGQLRSGHLFGRGDDPWLGATIDSRVECAGKVFFALPGETTDGHDYLADARSNGSCAVVVEREDIVDALGEAEAPFFLVKDVLVSLQELSRSFRNTLDLRVVAITGSAGKTTTKEYVRLVLRKKYKVHCNPGNLNNHIGVPLTLLGTDQDSEYLVSEIGANHVGEVEFLAGILRPDVGVITNIGDAHIGLFGSRESIAQAKAELLLSIESEGYAVLPQDDDYFDVLQDAALCRVVTFGYGDTSDFRVSAVEDEGDRIDFQINDQMLAIHSVGQYNVLNAAAAFAVGDVCGVETGRSREALAEAEALGGRARLYRLGEIVLIDDSYNANPTSMRVSLESLTRVSAKRFVAILGDMAELGSYSDGEHEKLGRFIAGSPIEVVYYLGESGSHVAAGVGSQPNSKLFLFESIEELCDAVEQGLRAGDAVLVKASRSVLLDKVVTRLRRTLQKEGTN